MRNVSRNLSRAPSKNREILSEHFSDFAKPNTSFRLFRCNSKRTFRVLQHYSTALTFTSGVSGQTADR